MDFEIKKYDAGGRLGILNHNEKKIITPNLFPVVSPFNNIIQPQEIKDEFGCNAIFVNAYILFNKPDQAEIALKKGIHNYLKFDGLIATDSGAFQHYMYGNKNDISSTEIEKFQEKIGADFPVILDLPVQLDDSREIAENKINVTIKRAKENISKRISKNCSWFGPIHGGKYLDIVKRSTLEMNKLDFGIYAIGGVVKTFNDYLFNISTNIILTVRRFLRPDRPLHLFGAGLPQFFSLSVACGIDTMDSAAYVLYAKEGRYFTLTGTKNIFNLTELPCNCPICNKYSADEIKKLYKQDSDRNKGIEMIARHNLYISFGELKTIREAIRSGTLWNIVEQRIHSHPKLINAYKQLPKYWPQLEINQSIEKTKSIFFLGEISKSRPIFYGIIKKIFQHYSMTEKCNLLLLPELESSVLNSPTLKRWIRQIEEMNNRIDNDNNQNIMTEIVIISNLFGPIPYKIINITPLVQREWEHNYNKTNWEFYSFLKYQKLNPDEILSIPDNKFKKSSLFLEELSNMKENSYEKMPEFKNDMYDLEKEIQYDDIINRIELSVQFLKKHQENIKNLVILKPSYFFAEDGNKYLLKPHLIDDLIHILKRNSNLLNKNIKIKVIPSIEEFNMQ